MIPARYDLHCQPGATFEAKIFLCLDENYEPVDVSAYTPMAKVRLSASDPVILDLTPQHVTPGPLPNPITFSVGSQMLTCIGHGLAASMNLVFSTPGTLPKPLRIGERYIVLGKNLTVDTFSVISFHSAMLGATAPVRIESAGNVLNFVGTKTIGQILLPEKSDEVTNGLADANAIWDLMLEDGAGRRLAPFAKGSFFIERGVTP